MKLLDIVMRLWLWPKWRLSPDASLFVSFSNSAVFSPDCPSFVACELKKSPLNLKKFWSRLYLRPTESESLGWSWTSVGLKHPTESNNGQLGWWASSDSWTDWSQTTWVTTTCCAWPLKGNQSKFGDHREILIYLIFLKNLFIWLGSINTWYEIQKIQKDIHWKVSFLLLSPTHSLFRSKHYQFFVYPYRDYLFTNINV